MTTTECVIDRGIGAIQANDNQGMCDGKRERFITITVCVKCYKCGHTDGELVE